MVGEVFDRRTGLVAGAFLLASPLFLIDSSVFLPYAPTTLLNLCFAVAYVRVIMRPIVFSPLCEAASSGGTTFPSFTESQ